MSHCNYRNDALKYRCRKPGIPKSSFCIFHDENYHKTNAEIVIGKLGEEICKSINDKKPLNCIGYYLPEISLSKIAANNFTYPIRFIEVKFCGKADFKGAKFISLTFLCSEFKDDATFNEMEFQDVSFLNTVFQRADFTAAFLDL